jgi:hypothetical protein
MLALLAIAASLALARASDPAVVAGAKARAATPVKPSRPVAADDPLVAVDLAAMTAQATAHDLANGNVTDCRAFMTQYEFSVRLMPERGALRDVFDALRLAELCGVTPPAGPTSSAHFAPRSSAELAARCDVAPVFVDAALGRDDAASARAGSIAQPFRTFARALAAVRSARGSARRDGRTACIVLRAGVHHLEATQLLSPADSGLIVTSFDGDSEPAWFSGGVALRGLTWTAFNVAGGQNVYVADVSAAGLRTIPGLQTLSDAAGAVPTRLFPAYYPNSFDIEFFNGNLPGDREVSVWRKPPIMAIPTLVYKDLKAAGLKDDSTMREYNIYAAGQGGPCDHWEQPADMWAYVCSNSTAGGWEEIERGFASTGQLGFPIGAVLNNSNLPPNVAKWTAPDADPSDWANAPIITQWHNQGWYQASYAVTKIAQGANTELTMTADGTFPSGGWQGGRTMENCDPDNLDPSEPLCSGPWYVRNVKEELDYPGEYWYDAAAQKLYVFYNASSGTPPPADFDLAASQLEVFFNLTGTMADPVVDVEFAGLGLRDQRHAQLERWTDPSGGDWGIRRAALFHLEFTERVTISGNTFYRTDANAVMVTNYNRNATVIDNEFAFVGMSCVVTFGNTVQDDGTAGTQPWGTVIAYNKAHEIGQYQLQSSLWFTSRATMTRAEGNVVFNIPRAAIASTRARNPFPTPHAPI